MVFINVCLTYNLVSIPEKNKKSTTNKIRKAPPILEITANNAGWFIVAQTEAEQKYL